MKKGNIEKIFEILAKDNPEPKTELNYTNDFTLLVAVVLSAQATDIGVNKATDSLFKKANSPEKIYALGENGLKKYIKTIGLFNSKAKNVISLSKILIEKHNSKVPQNFDDLIALPGVGRKTANVFLNCFCGEETIAVDTHVFRVSNRTGIVKAKNELETELQLLKKIPKKYIKNAHHWLILQGRYTCKARKPSCNECKIVDFCKFKEKNI